MSELENTYQQLCVTTSDINEHLPVLRRYASECDIVVELGVRAVVSTFAFLAAKPKKLISVDITHPQEFGGCVAFERAKQFAKENNIQFDFIQKSSLDVNLPDHDLLFIDTWHCYRQLLSELTIHQSKVSKYIILHDTVLFGFRDETDYGPAGTGSEVGLRPALEKFLLENNQWIIKENLTNNNGLTVLARK